MSQKYTIGAEIALDGEKDFRLAVTDINKELTILSTELKKVSAEYEGNENCVEALTAKQSTYEKQIEQYKGKIDVINKAIEHSTKVWGENSRVVLTWQSKLAIAEAGLIKAEKSLKNVSVQLGGQEAEYQSTGNAARIFSSEISAVNDKLGINESELKKLAAQYSDNAGGVDALTAKQKIYLDSIENQKQKIAILNDALKDSEERYGAGSKETLKWRKQLTDAETALIKTEKSLDTLNDELNKQDSELDEAEKAVKDYAKSLDNANASTITFGDLLKSNVLGDLLADGFREAASYVKNFIHNGIELASNLTEVQNVVDTTFGDGAEQIYQWADAAAESFGMSSLSAQQYNGTMGAMLKSMGLADDAVREMSMDMVGLAGDIASFHNLDVKTAFEKIRSGISGETEPLKQLGINMSVANLEAYALAQGIETAYKNMTEAEKATLRYNYLMSQTADAQGDFARTSDSYANQQRILQLNVENLSASLGEKLLPKINEITTTANDKLPKLEPVLENIGDLIADITAFALDNAEAIIAMASGYAAFTGASAVGNGIMTVVNAVKSLKSANDAATVSQNAMNAAANANPYVLLASAVIAVVSAVVVYCNTVENTNKEIQNLKKSTDEAITSSEGEIAVIERKAARYEELREKTNRTNAETAELKDLAQELQQVLPAGTEIINAQTGAYNSLAGALDNVVESMRQQAHMDAYKKEYEKLIEKQIVAQEEYDKLTQSALSAGAVISDDGELDFGSFSNAFSNLGLGKHWTEARDSLTLINYEVKQSEQKIQGYYDTMSNSAKQASETVVAESNGARIAAEGVANQLSQKAREDFENYDNKLKEKVTLLDDSLALRQTDEEGYYRQLKEYLDKNVNTESKVYFEQLTRYEKYIENKNKASEKSASATVKANTAAEKSTQKSYDNQLSEAKKYFDEVYDLYKDGEIEREEYERQVTELNKKYSEQRTDLSAYEFKKNKELLKESLTEITKDYESTLSDIQNKADSYRSSLMKSFKDILTFDKDDDGKIKGVHAGAEIKEATADAEQYIALLEELRNRGVSEGLIGHLKSMSIEEGMATAEYYSKLTDKQLKGLEKNWNSYEQAMSKLSAEMYSSDIESATDAYFAQIKKKLDECDDDMKEAGLKIVSSLISAFNDEGQAQTLLQHLDAMFSSAEKSGTESAFEAGQNYMKSLANGIESSYSTVWDSIIKAREKLASGFSDFEKQFNVSANLIMSGLSMGEKNTSEKSSNGTVINFNQTNTSPKALDTATINRQTRQGLQLASVMK